MARRHYRLLLATVLCLVAACAAREKRSTADEAEVPIGAESPTDQSKINTRHVDAAHQIQMDQLTLNEAPRGQSQEGPQRQEIAVAERKSAALAKVGMPTTVAPATSACCVYSAPVNTERYAHLNDNPVHRAAAEPVSTFSIDVDTGSYANVRRFLNAGQLPPADAVRVEEMINYFEYEYPQPQTRAAPFRVNTEVAPAPWNRDALLLRIGIKGYALAASARPPANLVFLVDVSGSMYSPDKLPLLKNGLRMLTQQLSAKDRVAIVVYAGRSGVALESTPGDQRQKILGVIDSLEAGGSTNGSAGIQRAYQVVHENFLANGVNRVILATDGDFNVGVVDFHALLDLAKREHGSGVALTTLGFGAGNYNDQLLEQLADAGDGNHAYIDTISEARKVLVEELSSTLVTIAKDVKVQVEFNPALVAEYRLIGYENRALAREDFNNDQVDAGDIGAGHRVTALYEIIPVGKAVHVDSLRYAPADPANFDRMPTGNKVRSDELAFVRLRYKQPDAQASQLLEYPILRSAIERARDTSADFQFAASVAAFGQKLRGGKYLGDFGYEDIRTLAANGLRVDREGYRREFISLVQLAQSLSTSAEKVSRAE